MLTSAALFDIYTCTIMLTVGHCMLITCFGSDINEKLRQYNQILNSTDDIETDTLRKKLNEIIAFHSGARELRLVFDLKKKA